MNIKGIQTIATTLRGLSMDGVEKAQSGHPGAPMGLAEIGSYLFFEELCIDAQNPRWQNRDRFVLSCGHASILLYSLLCLRGFSLTLDDLRAFRQLNSRTPGHPERDSDLGIEVSTGPLGQGFANGVGFAIAERSMSARFNTKEHRIVDHFTVVIASDGCMMEGITAEAASLAGHLGLGKLIVFYDANKISIDGSTDLSFSEDVAQRFVAYHWQTLTCDGHDIQSIQKCMHSAKADTERPSLIVCRTHIGRGSVNKEGSFEAHGAPLGSEDIIQTKESLGLPSQAFFVPPEIDACQRAAQERSAKRHAAWTSDFEVWKDENPGLYAEWEERFSLPMKTAMRDIAFPHYEPGSKLATRKAGAAAIQAIANALPAFIGGSADLTGSNGVGMALVEDFQKETPLGKQFRFGVREHAMAGISNGIALYGGFVPFCATFLVFSDYLRPALRLSALMNTKVIYVFSHDSIFLGEDGPTHQPVEHLAALRAIPNLVVLRPADGEETNEAWKLALQHEGPSCIVVSRQGLQTLEKHEKDWIHSYQKGAYVQFQNDTEPKNVVLATGSELALAYEAVKLSGISARVVSVSDLCRFKQDRVLQEKLIPKHSRVFTIEAGVAQAWEYFTEAEYIISIDRFGLSGPAKELERVFGFDVETVAKRLHRGART